MAARGTFDSKRAQARALFDQGLSCRAIATKLGVSTSTISRWAKSEGLAFKARAQTATATAVREFDMAAARVRLAEKMTANADRVLDTLDGPYLVYSFGGKDNDYNEHTLDEAPISARREAQTIGAIAFDKLTKAIESTEDADGLAPVESMLGRLAVRFGLADA
jgi:transposase-like protein